MSGIGSLSFGGLRVLCCFSANKQNLRLRKKGGGKGWGAGWGKKERKKEEEEASLLQLSFALRCTLPVAMSSKQLMTVLCINCPCKRVSGGILQ